MICIKRVYEPTAKHDGERYLVDRLWPRGVTGNDLKVAGWIKDVAPTTALRKWFGHDPAKWPEFQRRYAAELEKNPSTWKPLLEAARRGTITLVFGARDPAHNNALAPKGSGNEARTKCAPSSCRLESFGPEGLLQSLGLVLFFLVV